MSPFLSTARLGIHRATVLSGAKVDCCTGPVVTTVPPVTLSWYQRGASSAMFPGFATLCVSQSDSAPFRFVYWFWTISRSCSASSAFPFFAGAVPGPWVHDASVTLDGPVTVEFAVLLQST